MELREFIDYISRKANPDGVVVFKEIDRNGVYNDEFSTSQDWRYSIYVQAPMDGSWWDYPLDTELHVVPDENGDYLYAGDLIEKLEEHARATIKADVSEFHLMLHSNHNGYDWNDYREYMFSEMTASQISYAGDNVFEITYSHGKNFLHHIGRSFTRGGASLV